MWSGWQCGVIVSISMHINLYAVRKGSVINICDKIAAYGNNLNIFTIIII